MWGVVAHHTGLNPHNGCALNSSDGYCKNNSFDCDLDEILRYKNEDCFAYDGKRVRWTDSFEMLKIFTKYAIEQPGNWLSPGGKYKKFTSSNSDLIFTWNYELGTLSFKGEMGDRLKKLFITDCMMGESLPADRSCYEPVASNNDKSLSVSRD